MDKQDVPFEATPQALHFRLCTLEEKIDDMPDYIVTKLKAKLPTLP